MPIIRKSSLANHLAHLEQRFDKLKKELTGVEPNPNIYNVYHNDPIVYKEEFTEVNELEVKLAIEDFNAILKELRQIKKLQATKRS
ncbi:hypothetical protein [Vibrio aestuarianus]|uniref:Uncharacterized protein n=1 Tax=Vibrio aestuarianus TaxID=28171 RepID=A0ABD7YSM4_9VIBR|nr:hypothetical protein [Vibrio aestuarianus]WGK87364.1 hypothetical protein PYE67_14685 [Vibrio aestuarianus]CAH8206662.1 conserved hypothetical protein [Vibrio aestuarianus]